jgi:hypothetical protein
VYILISTISSKKKNIYYSPDVYIDKGETLILELPSSIFFIRLIPRFSVYKNPQKQARFIE